MQLAVDEQEHMYTWGSSPQALRLANQIKRRANAKQKSQEQQRREMSKIFEATMNPQQPQVPSYSEAIAAVAAAKNAAALENLNAQAKAESSFKPEGDDDQIIKETSILDDAECSQQPLEVPTLIKVLDDAEVLPTEPNAVEEIEQNPAVESIVNVIIASSLTTVELSNATETSKPVSASSATNEENGAESSSSNESQENAPQKQASTEIDPCEHMSPHLVDTSEVAGQILQVSFILLY